MKKILTMILALMLLCSVALADSTVQLSEDGKTLNVTLPNMDWYCEIEDENVIANESGMVDGDTDTATFNFTPVAEGSTRIRFTNDTSAVSVAVAVDAESNVSIIGVTNGENGLDNITSQTISESNDELELNLNGTGWDYEIENENVVAADGIEENEAADSSEVSFYSVEPGITDITLSNGIDEETVSVLVDENGEMSVVDTTESDANAEFIAATTIEIAGDNASMTVSYPGNVTAVIDDPAVLVAGEAKYDEENNTWTGTYTAGVDGITDLTVTDGEHACVISVYVYEGGINTAWDECEDAVSAKAYINPNNYDTMEVYEVYQDEDGYYIDGALGTMTEGNTEGFGEADEVVLPTAVDATIKLPDTEAAADSEVYDYVGENGESTFYAAIEMNDDGEITSFEYISAK